MYPSEVTAAFDDYVQAVTAARDVNVDGSDAVRKIVRSALYRTREAALKAIEANPSYRERNLAALLTRLEAS